MSLTSCFKYAIELPESTLTALLRSVIAAADTTDLPLTFEDTADPVDGYTPHISARLVDSDDRPSVFDLTAADLAAQLQLHMEIDVTILELAGLEPIVYDVDFDLPGTIARNDAADPALIEFRVGTVAVGDLNMVVTGGELVFTGALFEPFVDQMYEDNTDLHHTFIPNVDTGPDGVFAVQFWLYNDPTNGEITADVPTAGTLRLGMPGRMTMTRVSGETAYDFPITLDIDIGYETQPTPSGGEELAVRISAVQEADIAVTYGPGAPIYQAFMTGKIREAVVAELSTIEDPVQPIPSIDDVDTRIGTALVDYASGMVIPLFPLDPTASSIAIDSAVPTTIGASVLALQVEDEAGAPCDGPDDFTSEAQVAIAMGAPEVQRRLEAVADDIDGQEIEVEGYDVTIHRPVVALANAGEHGVGEGHIWVEGDVTVHVGGCVGDVGADYSGPLMLDPVMNPDNTIGFDVRAGAFQGDADVKDKKDDFDPDKVADFIEGWDFSFPTIPGVFEGVGTLTLNIDTVVISREGIVLRGGVEILRLHALMMTGVLAHAAFWDLESAGGGGG